MPADLCQPLWEATNAATIAYSKVAHPHVLQMCAHAAMGRASLRFVQVIATLPWPRGPALAKARTRRADYRRSYLGYAVVYYGSVIKGSEMSRRCLPEAKAGVSRANAELAKLPPER